jgi:hypothetical protein
MAKPIVKIVNATTGEEIEREMNANEFAQYKADQLAEESRLAEAAAKTTTKNELLARLGITAEEAQLLLS